MLDEISQGVRSPLRRGTQLVEGRRRTCDQSWQAQSMLGAAQQRLNTIATQRERKQVLKQLTIPTSRCYSSSNAFLGWHPGNDHEAAIPGSRRATTARP